MPVKREATERCQQELAQARERIAQLEQTERDLTRRLRFEKGITAATACLTSAAEPRETVTRALACLCETTNVSRVYVFENFNDPTDGLCIRQTCEACAPGVKPEIDNEVLQHVPYQAGFDRWRELLSAGRSVLGDVNTFPDSERELLEPQGILSILVLPLSIGGRWSGLIGFDETRSRRVWRDEEVDLLRTAADLIGSYLARTQAEKSLHESEARFKALVDQSLFSIQILDENGQTKQINQAFERLWGVRFADLVGYNMLADSQMEELGILPYIRRAYAGEAVTIPPMKFFGEKSLGPGKGNVRWVLARVFPVKDGTGQVREVTLMHEDVTERTLAEEALRRTQFAMDRANDSVLWVGDGGEIIYANDSACSMLSYSREELLSMTVFDIDPDFPRQNWENHKEQMRRDRTMSFESRHVAKDGRIFPVEVSSNYFEIDGRFCACAFDRDISDRKQAEAALMESEKRFRLLVQNSNDIIQIMDPYGVPTYVSDQVTRILGYQPEELVGVHSFGLVHPDDMPAILETIAAGLGTPGKVAEVEYRIRHKNGHWVHMEAVGCNLLHDPAVNGIVLNIRDVSERKKADEERHKLQEQLQQAMKMEAVGRLAGGVAHDFNNLLTGISGNVQLALLDMQPNDPLSDTLKEVGRAADSAASLTRQLLAFSRKQLIEPRMLDLNELISSMHKMLARLIGEDIRLHTLPGTELGVVKVDPGQFEQILVNLVVNARDAMPNGGKLVIETSNVELDEEYCRTHNYARPGRHVMLAVSDTGVGMSQHTKEHLFEPFFTTKEKGKGTGLGLATIYGTVKQAGGNIEVYSEEGQGTTFKIYLPRVEEAAEKLETGGVTTAMPGGKETILLVEDEEMVRNLATRLLKRLGYDVLSASSGGDAIVAAEEHSAPIHLLLTDVVMPGMNGRQLADRIAEIHAETKVLYTSGYTENAIAHHGVIDKGLAFIGKPYTPQTLAKAIRKVLDGPAEA